MTARNEHTKTVAEWKKHGLKNHEARTHFVVDQLQKHCDQQAPPGAHHNTGEVRQYRHSAGGQ